MTIGAPNTSILMPVAEDSTWGNRPSLFFPLLVFPLLVFPLLVSADLFQITT
jgi:hypothetical protein